MRAASISPAGLGQLLFVGRNLNFQLTSDQPLTKVFGGTKYRILDISAAWKSGGAAAVLYLSLSTGSTAACTADVFVYGYALD